MSKYQEETSLNSKLFWVIIYVSTNYKLINKLINDYHSGLLKDSFISQCIPVLLVASLIVLIYHIDTVIDSINDILDNKVGFKIVIKRREDEQP